MLNRSTLLVLFVIGGASTSPSSALADDNRPAMVTAARELNRQMNILQEVFGTDSRLMEINGLFQQTINVQLALEDFRQKVTGQGSREEVVIAFDLVDRKLTAILDEIRQVEKDDAGLRVVCRRLRIAASDLHFAVFAGDGAPLRQAERLYRQTLSQQAFVDSLSSNVDFIFAGRATLLNGWKSDMAELRKSLKTLQQLEQDKATDAQLKQQFQTVDENWSAIMRRFDNAKQDAVLLRGFVALVDQGFARMAPLVGVKDRRAPLADY